MDYLPHSRSDEEDLYKLATRDYKFQMRVHGNTYLFLETGDLKLIYGSYVIEEGAQVGLNGFGNSFSVSLFCSCSSFKDNVTRSVCII